MRDRVAETKLLIDSLVHVFIISAVPFISRHHQPSCHVAKKTTERIRVRGPPKPTAFAYKYLRSRSRTNRSHARGFVALMDTHRVLRVEIERVGLPLHDGCTRCFCSPHHSVVLQFSALAGNVPRPPPRGSFELVHCSLNSRLNCA